MTKQRTAIGLTYAGTLPFLGLSLMPWFIPDFLGLDYGALIRFYGAIIVAFIAGIGWGLYLYKDAPINLFIHSNIAALMAWSALILPPLYAETLLILCFAYLLYLDHCLYQARLIDGWFYTLRIRATLIVTSALLVNIAQLALY